MICWPRERGADGAGITPVGAGMGNTGWETICRNNDFRRIYSRGKHFVSPLVVVYVIKNRTGNVRVGITTSKKIGNAVQRNRSRRCIREACRECVPKVKNGYDLVFVARGKTPHVKSTEIARSMHRLLQSAGVLQ